MCLEYKTITKLNVKLQNNKGTNCIKRSAITVRKWLQMPAFKRLKVFLREDGSRKDLYGGEFSLQSHCFPARSQETTP